MMPASLQRRRAAQARQLCQNWKGFASLPALLRVNGLIAASCLVADEVWKSICRHLDDVLPRPDEASWPPDPVNVAEILNADPVLARKATAEVAAFCDWLKRFDGREQSKDGQEKGKGLGGRPASAKALACWSGRGLPANPSLAMSRAVRFKKDKGNWKADRDPVLNSVRANRALSPAARAWYESFTTAAEALHGDRLLARTISTRWRLAIGLSNSPALETCLTLHPLHGFPYIPATALRGMLRRQFERENFVGRTVKQDPSQPLGPEIPADLGALVANAERFRSLFGDFNLPASDEGSPSKLLDEWRKRLEEAGTMLDADWARLRERIDKVLVAEPTSGSLLVLDALPEGLGAAENLDWLELDVMTPHYTRYYRGLAKFALDSESPVPIHFPVVKRGKSFEFRLATRGPQDMAGTDRDELIGLLERGLAEIGVGGKTTAGYGRLGSRGAAEREEFVEFERVTTARCGGYGAGTDQSIALRPPSIRGALRFWTRALADEDGREIETRLWGGTVRGQRIQIRAVEKGQDGRLRIAFLVPDDMEPDDRKRASAVIWTWLQLGGIGRRSRRGSGSLLWHPDDGDFLNRKGGGGWPFLEPAHDTGQVKLFLRNGLSKVLKTFGVGPRPIEPTGERFCLVNPAQVYVGEEIADCRDAKSVLSKVAGLSDPKRSGRDYLELGRASDDKAKGRGGGRDRLASPMVWRVMPAPGGTFRVIMTWSPNETASFEDLSTSIKDYLQRKLQITAASRLW
ncbi:MAG: type III-B CRISPR module RAMP protein Cmr6 [Planctomycetes bacterium]|nr:type III-B CRISPR module RAMP protein Cmr6 [Planctomycetota bacterium]